MCSFCVFFSASSFFCSFFSYDNDISVEEIFSSQDYFGGDLFSAAFVFNRNNT